MLLPFSFWGEKRRKNRLRGNYGRPRRQFRVRLIKPVRGETKNLVIPYRSEASLDVWLEPDDRTPPGKRHDPPNERDNRRFRIPAVHRDRRYTNGDGEGNPGDFDPRPAGAHCGARSKRADRHTSDFAHGIHCHCARGIALWHNAR